MQHSRAATAAARTQLVGWLNRSHMRPSELASQLEITRPYMSQILHGERRPSLELLMKIARITGVPVVAWVDTGVSESGKEQIA